MKVCSLYGAGYYYMPGTDICLKLGGYVRFQTMFGTSENTRPGGLLTNRFESRVRQQDAQYGWRTRALITVDTRQQTAYGTLRTYFLIGYQHDTNGAGPPAAALYATRGFIQIAGFTFGKATSFFDHFPTAGRAYAAGNFHNSSTGDGGWNVMAYTAQFGNGVSATIALEESRNRAIYGAGAYTAVAGAGLFGFPGTVQANGSLGRFPDVVANLRVDQAWGSAMIGGALVDSSASYYGGAVAGGNPGNRTGWAVTAATQINLPMLARGSSFNAQFIYAEGATQYASHTSAGAGFTVRKSATTAAFGATTDGVLGTAAQGGNVELTTAWSLALAIEHAWTPALKTSLYGSYLDVSHNARATTLICTNTAAALVAAGAVCNPDWSAWNIGSRTEWEPVRGLTLGVDVVYNKLNTAVFHNAAGVFPGTAISFQDADSWAGVFRIQRNFLP